MISALCFALLLQAPIPRDPYGVPSIRAQSWEGVFEEFGYAVAEDRLWQMEMSRRVALGTSAELLGPSAIKADQDARRTSPTPEELTAQFMALQPRTKAAWQSYANGVNRQIAARKAAGTLPAGYEGTDPRPWTVTDSAAIAVMMARRFGSTGGLELTHLAAMGYLQGQKAKDRVWDVVDDLAWQNEPDSPTTLPVEDESKVSALLFPKFTRADSERHLASLPKLGLLELMPALQLSQGESQAALAMQVGAPSKLGSYAIAVGAERSATGTPILLSGPQMGHPSPAVIHEVVIDSPALQVAGINVPGVPVVVIGSTPHIAWGLTTGVADVSDVVWFPTDGESQYQDGSTWKPIQTLNETINVKGADPTPVTRQRAGGLPVMLHSRGNKALFAMRRACDGRELDSWQHVYELYEAKTAQELLAGAAKISLNFNLFFATRKEIGWAYCGLWPVRQDGWDPRLPIPGGPEGAWRRLTPMAESLRIVNPTGGLLVNWNNKPVRAFENLDTPFWGSPHRVEVLAAQLPSGRLSPTHLEEAVRMAAMVDKESLVKFLPIARRLAAEIPGAEELAYFDGRMVEGSVGAWLYDRALENLKQALFIDDIGNFINPTLFNTAIQSSVLWRAYQGRSRFPYLGGANAEDLFREAIQKAVETLGTNEQARLLGYRAPAMRYPDQMPVPYSNRASSIQVFEMREDIRVRSVLPPGQAESGAQQWNQLPLAHGWRLKPLRVWRGP